MKPKEPQIPCDVTHYGEIPASCASCNQPPSGFIVRDTTVTFYCPKHYEAAIRQFWPLGEPQNQQ
jgi:hypothetical protein